jgi:hypothetical protein
VARGHDPAGDPRREPLSRRYGGVIRDHVVLARAAQGDAAGEGGERRCGCSERHDRWRVGGQRKREGRAER